MKYKNIFALGAVLVLFLAGQAINAQTQSDPSNSSRKGQGRRYGRAYPGFDQLNLTPDQQTKLKTIHESTQQQIEAIRNDSTLSQTDREAKLRTVHESARQQLQAILTPDQLKTLAEGRNRFGHDRDRFADLGLSADQQARLAAIHKSSQEQLAAVRNDATLTSDQKQAKVRSIFQNSQQQVMNILTPEQQQKLRDRGPGGFGHRPRSGDQQTPTPTNPE